MDINEVEKVKDHLSKSTKHGFKYFIKNISLIVLVMLLLLIVKNPDVILNPEQVFSNLNSNVLIMTAIIFFIIGGIYQIAKGLVYDNQRAEITATTKEAEKIAHENDEIHSFLVDRRIEVGPKIRSKLKDLIINLGASRATVCEMHNGTKNFSGVPFVFLDCIYEETDNIIDDATDDFQNFNLGKYVFISNHFKEGVWIGSIDEIMQEDRRLGLKLRAYGETYGAIIVINGLDHPLGFLTVSFTPDDEIPNKEEILLEITKSVQEISTLLDSKYMLNK